ncbi:MAG TPA: lamin tail domain-containing protein [Candidatus Sumerlaeota bacterium]|nr:lamin tail domain-containing protein [Candidatus Sumerlaeota bacterium]
MSLREPVRRRVILGVSLGVLILLPLAEIAVRGFFGEVARPRVVINEIFYHAPNNENALEYVELYNASDQPVDLSGWAFFKGIQYKFPEGSMLDADRYLVVCRDVDVFKKNYAVEPFGQFKGSLKNKGERVELADRHGKRVDSVKFDRLPPWPTSPDGVSASLERICPFVSGERWDNWGPSVMPLDDSYPAGTPGEQNTCFRRTLPPAVASVTFAPHIPEPDQPILVEAQAPRTAHAELLYRLAGSGMESEETSIPMVWQGTRFVATIPGQDAGRLVRFRIQTRSEAGDSRFFPAEDDLRPAFSAYVTGPVEVGKIPVGFVINVGEAEYKAAQEQRSQLASGGFFGFGGGPGGPGGPGRSRT